MNILNTTDYNTFLNEIAKNLDISEIDFKNAENRYNSLTEWLSRENSSVKDLKPDLYPQGSFRFGTVIKPITEEEEYDIDIVCELDYSSSEITQAALKQLILDEVKEYAVANNMNKPVKEGNRCCTLLYADGAQFHMDILPAIPKDYSTTPEGTDAIKITDKNHENYLILSDDWLESNPRGFAKWFEDKNRVRFNEQFLAFSDRKFASIEGIPKKNKTPLQRVVQLLKRHRDMYFAEKERMEDKPISMIITTLAAMFYQQEQDTYSAFKNIIDRLAVHADLLKDEFRYMDSYHSFNVIKRKSDGTWQILNPVNPNENFADHWHEKNNRKARVFFEWINVLKNDFEEPIRKGSILAYRPRSSQCFGNRIVNLALGKLFPVDKPSVISNTAPAVIIKSPSAPWGDR